MGACGLAATPYHRRIFTAATFRNSGPSILRVTVGAAGACGPASTFVEVYQGVRAEFLTQHALAIVAVGQQAVEGLLRALEVFPTN